MARPLKEINWEMVEKKMEAGCSAREIYGGICDADTFYRRFKTQYGTRFEDYGVECHTVGKGNIRLKQYLKAMNGSDRMLTILGEQWLDQGKEKELLSPHEDSNALLHENMMLKAALEKATSDVNKPQAE